MESGQRALRRGRHSQAGQVYLLTAVTLQRQPWFRDDAAARAAARSFGSQASLGDARLLAWVLMPDHAHWLLELGERDALAQVVRRIKSFSARSANAALQRLGPVWSEAYHDHALRREEDLRAVARYIVMNPLRAGLVQRLGDYPYWNAIWL
ncbi:transposase [Stagnimonas aquatica]|uniref:Transposase n=1 Tax=Stagnimonas aquatica TaxID=2689987 RepID=A0A3N0VMI1_9GAMM|nr:transposase [Stagnimonas aquatica]ROH93218.1 transposase [Stagnimonas aquatica]